MDQADLDLLVQERRPHHIPFQEPGAPSRRLKQPGIGIQFLIDLGKVLAFNARTAYRSLVRSSRVPIRRVFKDELLQWPCTPIACHLQDMGVIIFLHLQLVAGH